MKTLLFFVALFYILANAQVDSLKDQLSYYPLQNGDYWEYETKSNNSYGQSSSSAYSLEVIGDKTLNNGTQYKVILKTNIYPDNNTPEYYQRVDTATGYVYQYSSSASTTNYEIVTLILFTQPWGSISCPGYSLQSIQNISILGVPTLVQTFFASGAMSFYYRKYAKGFGFYGSSYSTSSTFGSVKLVYAKINGIMYEGNPPNLIMDNNNIVPGFYLNQNYPNPFNQSTVIKYQLSANGLLVLKIYDALGRELKTLVNETQHAGDYSVVFNGASLTSGVYYYCLQFNRYIQSKKFVLIK